MENNPWFAAAAAPQIGMDYGALLCTFNTFGEDDQAECQFQDINGNIFDEFKIRTYVSDDVPVQVPTKKSTVLFKIY
eukprot:TRINITY_DN17447_c0_g1_i1.p3 TRINITY_DN17447_c0_g1~~TRINITY_DN17447_c0_g1_i1.p3  ORF type:complete len:88 (-),score=18.33 TRINITY_DN17447_c0_g1_i1:392-622(-)